MKAWLLAFMTMAVGLHLGIEATRPLVRVGGDEEAFLLSQRIAEGFAGADESIDVEVTATGPSRSFAAFCDGELDAVGLTRRPAAEELGWCSLRGTSFVQVPVGYVAVAVVVHPKNRVITSLRLGDHRRLWLSSWSGRARTLRDLRPEWPETSIRLVGLDRDDGARSRLFDALAGGGHEAAPSYEVEADSAAVLDRVSEDEDTIGFVDLASALARAGEVRLVALDRDRPSDAGPVVPSLEAAARGDYAPFSAPVSVYVTTRTIERAPVQRFIDYYARTAPAIARDNGYLPWARTR